MRDALEESEGIVMSRETMYTMVVDYKGGTHISQVAGESPEEALTKWANTLSERDLTSLGSFSRRNSWAF